MMFGVALLIIKIYDMFVDKSVENQNNKPICELHQHTHKLEHVSIV
jgi:hypothetical protein